MADPKTRNKILDAANKRFGYYGFTKTSMAEIAKDCHMSAANIYRYFDGKNEILAVLALAIFQQQESQLNDIVKSSAASSAEKLHLFFQKTLQITWQYAKEQPKMREMVDFICHERLDLVQAQGEVKNRLIAEILSQGIANGEFIPMDINITACSFKEATVMFHTPFFMNMYSVEELSLSCEKILDLLLGAITVQK